MSGNWFCKFYLCCGGMKEKVDLQWIGGFFVSMALTSGFCFSAILQHILKSYEELRRATFQLWDVFKMVDFDHKVCLLIA